MKVFAGIASVATALSSETYELRDGRKGGISVGLKQDQAESKYSFMIDNQIN
jgi:hypothetical protein